MQYKYAIFVILLLMTLLIKKSISQQYVGNQTIFQEFVNGVFEQNNITAPEQFASCLDTQTADKIVEAMPDYYEKLTDIKTVQFSLVKLYSAFSLNPQTLPCINKLPEILSFYKVVDTSNVSLVDFVKWATDNFDTIKKEAIKLNNLWREHKYKQAGFENVALIETLIEYTKVNKNAILIKNNENNKIKNINILLQILNGIFQQNNLPPPQTLLLCLSQETQNEIVKALSPISMVSILSLSQLSDSLSPQKNKCLRDSEELSELLNSQYLQNISLLTIGQWATDNDTTISNFINTISTLMDSQRYLEVGKEFSRFIQNIIKQTNKDNIKNNGNNQAVENSPTQDQQINHQILQSTTSSIQLFFDGLFQQQGLPSPKIVQQCISDSEQQKIKSILQQFLQDCSIPLITNQTFNKLFQFIQNQDFINCINESIEFKLFLQKFGITNLNEAQKKIQLYISSQLLTTSTAFKYAIQNWNQNQFTGSGQLLSQWLASIFIRTTSLQDSIKDAQQTPVNVDPLFQSFY